MPPTIDDPALLADLGHSRPLFHSEANFQHALAWRIHETHPELAIRLEYRAPIADEHLYVDVWASDGARTIALELKYKTRALRATVAGESFDLLDQAAQNFGRYDVLKDLCRLERLAAAGGERLVGYGVFLTNDSAYWKEPRGATAADAPFRLHEGRILCGELAWGAAQRARETRDRVLNVSGSYDIHSADYSHVAAGAYGTFRYLLFRVEPHGRGESLSTS